MHVLPDGGDNTVSPAAYEDWPVGDVADSEDLALAKQLIDDLKRDGFTFQRIGLGEDAPLLGIRRAGHWADEVYITGLDEPCTAIRRRRSRLVLPGAPPVMTKIDGDAITVMIAVCDWPVT